MSTEYLPPRGGDLRFPRRTSDQWTSNATKLSLGVLQRVSEFLAELPEDQLLDIAEGRARIAYVPEGSPGPPPRGPTTKRAPAAVPPSATTKTLIEKLESMGSREAATREVAVVKTPDLRAIGKGVEHSEVQRHEGG